MYMCVVCVHVCLCVCICVYNNWGITIWGHAILVSLLYIYLKNSVMKVFSTFRIRNIGILPICTLLSTTTFPYCNSSPEFISPPWLSPLQLSTTQAAPYILCNSLLPRVKTPPSPHNLGLRICPHQSPASCSSVAHHWPPVSVLLLAKGPRDPSVHLQLHPASSTVDCGNVGLFVIHLPRA